MGDDRLSEIQWKQLLEQLPAHDRAAIGELPSVPVEPAHQDDDTSLSHVCLTMSPGSTFCGWTGDSSLAMEGQLSLSLSPGASVIIGRQEGGQTEYLDPAYLPTRTLPGTSQKVVSNNSRDNYVSRGHFMLRGSSQGIVFVNGVPRRGGGIRPPRNWTQMLSPSRRLFEEGEEFLIEKAASLKIHLPNGAVIEIGAT